jgi:dihydrofolate synthase/folylpolyglutamate synthase
MAMMTRITWHANTNDRLRSALAKLDTLVDWELGPRASMRVGLEPIRDLLFRLGNPETTFHSIHVTGTKGKGSVCALLESALLGAGCKVGRYASPHVNRINERISHACEAIGDEVLGMALEGAIAAKIEADIESTAGTAATWFDVITAAAFLSFREAGLDWVAVEVGIGGRLDSTNVINPEVTIVTNIGLEHTDVLGPTKEAIAYEKAGIIKLGVDVVTQVPLNTPEGKIVWAAANERRARLEVVPIPSSSSITARNIEIARAALSRLGARGFVAPLDGTYFNESHLTELAAENARLPGRLERRLLAHPYGRGTPIRAVIDGGHVAFAVEGVLQTLQAEPSYRAMPVVVIALAADKDAEAIVSALVGRVASLVCTSVNIGKRFWRANYLAAVASKKGLPSVVVDDVEGALRIAAASAACADTWILAVGSLYLAGQVRSILDGEQWSTMPKN